MRGLFWLLVLGCAFNSMPVGAESGFGLGGSSLGDRTASGQQPSFVPGTTSPPLRQYSIGGECLVFSEATPTIQLPCPNLTLQLEDDDGNRVASTSTTQGRYEFAALAKEKLYYLRIVSPKYRVHTGERIGPVKRGQNLTVRVKRVLAESTN